MAYQIKLKPKIYTAAMTKQLDEKSVLQTMEIQKELDGYEKILKEASIISSDRIFPNSGKEHAAIAMSILFNSTSAKVQLIVEDFCGEVSNNKKYSASLQNCMDKGVKAEVLILNKPNIDSEGYKIFYNTMKTSPDQVSMKLASEATKNLLSARKNVYEKTGESSYNLALFDNNKYRFEVSPSKFTALLSFNDPIFVSRYQTIFSDAFKTAVEIA